MSRQTAQTLDLGIVGITTLPWRMIFPKDSQGYQCEIMGKVHLEVRFHGCKRKLAFPLECSEIASTSIGW